MSHPQVVNVKEKPIIFGAPMIRALLAGTKTQTRRLVKPQPGLSAPYRACCDWENHYKIWVAVDDGDSRWWKCPYGVPGDRLWVRETWCPRSGGRLAMDEVCIPRYRADGELRPEWGFRWRSPIHMPRWASRITLEITGVRVERVQDITHRDCVAEGWPGTDEKRTWIEAIGDGDDACIEWYADLWDSINGKWSWKANPFVWRMEFKVLAPAVGGATEEQTR